MKFTKPKMRTIKTIFDAIKKATEGTKEVPLGIPVPFLKVSLQAIAKVVIARAKPVAIPKTRTVPVFPKKGPVPFLSFLRLAVILSEAKNLSSVPRLFRVIYFNYLRPNCFKSG